MTAVTDDDQMARWKRITEAATPAPWLHSLDKFDDEEYCALVCSDGPGYALFAKLGIEGVKPHCHTGEQWTAEDSAKRSAQEHLARSSQEMRDALFIEIARTAMPLLLAEVERLRAEVAELRRRLSRPDDAPPKCSCQFEIGDSACERHPTCNACGVVVPRLDAECPECDGYGNLKGATR